MIRGFHWGATEPVLQEHGAEFYMENTEQLVVALHLRISFH